ncbi:MAG: hypothetical protein AAF355_15735 [Myxococcota bacterium]
MNTSKSLRVLTSALALALSGCPDGDGASSSDTENNSTIPDTYDAPPRPCSVQDLDEPELALTDRGHTHTFLVAGSQRESLAVDYDVWPRHAVSQLMVMLAFDNTTASDPFLIEEPCPGTLSISALRQQASKVSSVGGDVVRALVQADGDDRSRIGELFFTNGSREIQVTWPVDKESTPKDQTDQPSLLLFEPAWGEPRLALAVVEPGEQGPLLLRGLPDGPGTLVWTRPTFDIDREVDAEVVYLPAGFREDWPAFSTAFRTTVLASMPDHGSTVAVDRGTDDFEYVWLRDEIEWTGDQDLLLVRSYDELSEQPPPADGSMPAEGLAPHGSVTMACGMEAILSSPSFSRVFLSDGAEAAEVELPFGETVLFTLSCESGETQGSLFLRVASRNGQDSRVLLQPAPPSEDDTQETEEVSP